MSVFSMAIAAISNTFGSFDDASDIIDLLIDEVQFSDEDNVKVLVEKSTEFGLLLSPLNLVEAKQALIDLLEKAKKDISDAELLCQRTMQIFSE